MKCGYNWYLRTAPRFSPYPRFTWDEFGFISYYPSIYFIRTRPHQEHSTIGSYK